MGKGGDVDVDGLSSHLSPKNQHLKKHTKLSPMTQLTNRYYEVAFEKKSKKMEEEEFVL